MIMMPRVDEKWTEVDLILACPECGAPVILLIPPHVVSSACLNPYCKTSVILNPVIRFIPLKRNGRKKEVGYKLANSN